MKHYYHLLLICCLPTLLNAENLDASKLLSQSVENKVAADYLSDADVKYTSAIGRTGISIMNYKNSNTYYYCTAVEEHKDRTPNWAEQSAGIMIVSKGASYIELSETYKFDNKQTISATGDTTKVFNLIPQKVYWYRTFNTSKKMVSKGVFKTQGKLRMIKSEQVLNVRDLGGWRCSGGGHLAYGKIFRGASIDGSNLTGSDKDRPIGTADKALFKDFLGIGLQLDLKDAESSSDIGSSVSYKSCLLNHYLYLLKNIKYSTSSKTFSTANQHQLLKECLESVANALKNNKPIYTHCTWGADRTGSLCAIIEGLCGVETKDMVMDWELTSLMAVYYHKFIDEADATYYEMVNGVPTNVGANLRSMFCYLHDNYGGKNGATVKEQITSFLKAKVFNSLSDKGASIMKTITDALVVPDTRSGVIIKDWSKEKGTRTYTVTDSDTNSYSPTDCKMVNATTGAMEDREAICCTDYIDCSGLSSIWMNVVSKNNAAFYDANKKFISGAVDSSVSSTYGANAIIMKDGVIAIPSNAKYVRFNMKKYCGWTAVMY